MNQHLYCPIQETGLRALVVDDDLDINRLLQVRLSTRGYEVASAINGEEALAWLTKNVADVIFLDVALPGISGLDVLESVRSDAYDTAVIMTTAFGSEQVVVDAMRRGADDYLHKPFEPSEFKTVLNRTVSRLQLNRQNEELRRQLAEKHRQLELELANAASVQADLLPREPPRIPGFELAAECVPAHEVGGDFYDWRESSHDSYAFWLCDVMGKGMPAALLMATVRAVMHAVVRESEPATAMKYVTSALDDDFARTNRFVTMFMTRLHPATRTLSYIDAGHGHAFVRRANGAVDILTQRGLPLGILPDIEYKEGSIVLEPGDALVIYSDGVIDARPELELTPELLAQRLDGTTSAAAIVDRFVALLNPVGVPPDDMTVVVLRCNS